MPISTSEADSESLIGEVTERPSPRWPFTRVDSIVSLVFGVIIAVMGVIIVLIPVAVTAQDLLSDPFPLLLCIVVLMTGMLCVPMLLLLMLGGSMIVWGVRALRHANELRERGRLVQGIIHERWTRGSFRRRRYYVTYRFTVELLDGSQQEIILTERNSMAHFNYKTGDPVQVRCLPEKPEICRIEG